MGFWFNPNTRFRPSTDRRRRPIIHLGLSHTRAQAAHHHRPLACLERSGGPRESGEASTRGSGRSRPPRAAKRGQKGPDQHAGQVSRRPVCRSPAKPEVRRADARHDRAILRGPAEQAAARAMSRSDIAAWRKKREADGLKYPTIKRHFDGLQGLLNHAVREEQITANPLSGVKLEKPATSEAEQLEAVTHRKMLTPEETAALFKGLEALNEEKRAAPAIASARQAPPARSGQIAVCTFGRALVSAGVLHWLSAGRSIRASLGACRLRPAPGPKGYRKDGRPCG